MFSYDGYPIIIGLDLPGNKKISWYKYVDIIYLLVKKHSNAIFEYPGDAGYILLHFKTEDDIDSFKNNLTKNNINWMNC